MNAPSSTARPVRTTGGLRDRRRIESRIRATGSLVADTPLHVGGAASMIGIDLVLAANGSGELYIPASTIAGVLRSLVSTAESVPPACVTVMFGDTANGVTVGRTRARSDQGIEAASLLVVEDAPLESVGISPEIRDHVVIDRRTGAAQTGKKFDRQIIPAGARFRFEVTLEVPVGTSPGQSLTPGQLEEWFVRIIGTLARKGVRLGAATTRGLGQVRLHDVRVRRFTMDAQSVFDYLYRDEPSEVAREPDRERQIPKSADGNAPGVLMIGLSETHETWFGEGVASDASLDISVRCAASSPVLVKGPDSGDAIDSFPLMTTVNGKLVPVIPGSSIKGVIRTTAERIVSTVLGEPIDSLDSVGTPVACGPIWALFGAPRHNDLDFKGFGRGALSVDDCTATEPQVDPVKWAELVAVAKRPRNGTGHEPFVAALDAAGLSKWRVAMHVAIDRWTGGAADGRLFSELEPWDVEWPEIGLRLDARRLSAAEAGTLVSPALVLLSITLADLADRNFAVGHGTSRGLGLMDIESIALGGKTIEFEAGDAASPKALLAALLSEARFGGTSVEDAIGAWKRWILAAKESISKQRESAASAGSDAPSDAQLEPGRAPAGGTAPSAAVTSKINDHRTEEEVR